MTDTPSPELAFESFTSGAQLFLSDGTVWRVGLKYIDVPRRWAPGDPVSISERRGHFHGHLVTNMATREAVPVVRSSVG